jgi:lipoprotein-anchoring transpeptidase ErfK/SrfK
MGKSQRHAQNHARSPGPHNSSLATACGSHQLSTASELKERVDGYGPDSWKDSPTVNIFLRQARALRVNALSNMATYYENGQPIARWKIATGRAGYETPKGIFRIHAKSICPPWNNGRGQSAGPCEPNNPLGRKALWFSSSYLYGLHGVNAAGLDSVTAEDPRERDRSAGCIRNHPENIEWLFARAEIGDPVIIGLWPSDPNVEECSGAAHRCASAPPRSPRLPEHLPMWCSPHVSSDGGLANVRSQPSTMAPLVQQLSKHHRFRVTQKVRGEPWEDSTDWFFVTYTLNGPKQGYLHTSVIDCATQAGATEAP